MFWIETPVDLGKNRKTECADFSGKSNVQALPSEWILYYSKILRLLPTHHLPGLNYPARLQKNYLRVSFVR